MKAILSCFLIILRELDLEKISPSITWNLRRLLFTHSLAMSSIVFKIVRICNSQFKCNYLKNQKPFLNFLLYFWNLLQILNVLKRKMIVKANVFPKLQTVKNLDWPISRGRRFRTPFDSQNVEASKILAKSPWENIYHFFPSFSVKLIWKMSPLVIGEIIKVFVNTLTADDKNTVQYSEILPLPIPIQLSEKQKNIFSIFCSISGSYIKF